MNEPLDDPKRTAANSRRIVAESVAENLEQYRGEAPTPFQTVEDRIVAVLAHDINDRRGLKWEWQKIDDDVKENLLETWREIIRQELANEVSK